MTKNDAYADNWVIHPISAFIGYNIISIVLISNDQPTNVVNVVSLHC